MPFADTAISITNIIGSVAKYGARAIPVIATLSAFIPVLAPVVPALLAAGPILDRIAAAVPIAVSAINAGRPIFDAVEKAAPTLLPELKKLFAIAANHDPARPETNMTAAEVSDHDAMMFAGPVLFGRAWTKAETERWFSNASAIDRT